jgi:hypothetical protein
VHGTVCQIVHNLCQIVDSEDEGEAARYMLGISQDVLAESFAHE